VGQFFPAFTNATVLVSVDGTTPSQIRPKRPITVRDVMRSTTGYGDGDQVSVREFYEREGLCHWGMAPAAEWWTGHFGGPRP
jgi:CubicO group peptidase (beta-lactamase class C family)